MSNNNELLEALTILEQEKNISKETLLEAIEKSKNYGYGRVGQTQFGGQ